VQVQILPHGIRSPIDGLLGGRRGGQASYHISGTVFTHAEGLTQLGELRTPADAVTIEAAGGSGFGDPTRRPLEAIARDLAEGYVTPGGLESYGAALSSTGEVRRARPARRPARPRARRGGRRRREKMR
jgi:N-methylhydantoinase B/oxoprolinase/acetone carboxylase alpha subunit